LSHSQTNNAEFTTAKVPFTSMLEPADLLTQSQVAQPDLLVNEDWYLHWPDSPTDISSCLRCDRHSDSMKTVKRKKQKKAMGYLRSIIMVGELKNERKSLPPQKNLKPGTSLTAKTQRSRTHWNRRGKLGSHSECERGVRGFQGDQAFFFQTGGTYGWRGPGGGKRGLDQ